MPVEFSAAAYRLGHSMVREAYSHNRIFTPGGVAPATLQLLFRFTGLSGGIVGDLAPNPPTAPTPISVLPSNWIIDWRRFHEVALPNPDDVPFNSRAGSIRSSCRRCTRCRATAGACRSAI